MFGIYEIEEKLKYKMNDTGPCNMDISVKISAICFENDISVAKASSCRMSSTR
jgi:hypothetical protein